jgi:hypothetical protein
MAMAALKEIRAAPDKRAYQDTVTGMRDFSTAVQDLDEDEVWRETFRQGLIRPASRRQPGGVRVADVSLAEYDDEEAFLAASTDRPFCSLEHILGETKEQVSLMRLRSAPPTHGWGWPVMVSAREPQLGVA